MSNWAADRPDKELMAALGYAIHKFSVLSRTMYWAAHVYDDGPYDTWIVHADASDAEVEDALRARLSRGLTANWQFPFIEEFARLRQLRDELVRGFYETSAATPETFPLLTIEVLEQFSTDCRQTMKTAMRFAADIARPSKRRSPPLPRPTGVGRGGRGVRAERERPGEGTQGRLT